MQNRVDRVVKILDDKKAENIEIIDMQGRDYLSKFVVVATTLAPRHGFALLDDLKSELKPVGEEFLGVESSDDWIVIDLGDIMIHLMSETYRAKYNIEEFLKELNIKSK
ncbi:MULTISPECIES: ribosome silencing factor [Campylobacter]|uniref:ribosome silencing factor n=1 Tax=Campylobacter TaxID=194 RepID=UPI000A32F61A|nr:ribosome silencing factor [Campylobacter sp. P0124]MCR8696245.1 ribosome silencing factor [Campylobacter sp. RM19073]